jgi:hypothetical protein
VRFFYWLFVVFDYVRAPALLLLPLWLGWELLQMLLNEGSRVAYSAHAGGIVSGALLALVVKQARWHREAWFDACDVDAPDPVSLYRQAQERLGRMQLVEAEQLLAQAAALAPNHFDIRLAQLRCAQYAGNSGLMQQRTAALLTLPGLSRTQTQELATLVQQRDESSWQALPDQALVEFGLRLAASGEADAALAWFARLDGRTGLRDELPQRWLQLAFRLRDAGQAGGMRQALRKIAVDHPGSPQAQKARLLLEAEGDLTVG